MIKAVLIVLFIILILIICHCIVLTKCRHLCNKYGGQKHIKPASRDLYAMSIEPMSATEGQRSYSDLYAMSYTISGEDNGLDYSQLRQLFKEIGEQNDISFTEKPVTEKTHISFGTFKNDAVVKGEVKRWNYDPLFFKQKTAIKNTLGEHHQLINKSELYDTIKKLIPNGIKYLPKSYTIKEIEQKIYNNTIKYPLIIKKDNVPNQYAIKIVLSKEEYYNAIKDLDIKNDAMISKYIKNPLNSATSKIYVIKFN